MSFVLTTHLDGRDLRVALAPGDNLVGSDSAADVHLPHPSVSRRHAMLRVLGAELELEDLGSSNGTRVGPRRIQETVRLGPGSLVLFGTLPAMIEEVREADLVPAIRFAEPVVPLPPPPAAGSETTLSVGSLERFTLEDLPRLLGQAVRGEHAAAAAQAVGAALFETLPCLWLEIRSAGPGESGLLFRGARPGAEAFVAGAPRAGEVLVVTLAGRELRALVPSAAVARHYRPVAESGLALVELGLRSPRGFAAPPAVPAVEPPEPRSLDAVVQRIYSQARRVATGQVSVLILGESGTGKEVLARYLHRASGREEDRLVTLNCAALPRDLLEAELFGVERGVATGVDSRPGKFELADGGTLMLDEIGDMALETQAKILRVLQEGEVYRLGAKTPRSARVRVVAATNRNLEELMQAGQFRGDLYHRIADWVVELPPLRDRRVDVPNLAAFFLAREGQKLGKGLRGISEAAIDALSAYDWPGNIRQLEREITRAALFLEAGELLDTSRLSPRIAQARPRSETLQDLLDATERAAIERALAAAQGDTAKAADRLGIGRSTLYRRMKVLGLATPEGAAGAS